MGPHQFFVSLPQAHAHTIDDFIFFEIGIQVAQTEVEIKI